MPKNIIVRCDDFNFMCLSCIASKAVVNLNNSVMQMDMFSSSLHTPTRASPIPQIVYVGTYLFNILYAYTYIPSRYLISNYYM
ncbi:uncharacterized protein GGS25DRAFT_508406 [Hypoxylon fragiforme]|uniref:uncharacterized protein n=1 Tax=Hypoxylon fragiforme TaxID=63214 RepID=UPI0020C5B9FE|nr:uncharacterized protein GGS25DRAFT_508406 [Hypoxylon fragiforme]KAI2604483.1 hypothetical protein GGS25DRAFT_508406 [Hypoxylon fragiforme]